MGKYIKWLIRIVSHTVLAVLGFFYIPVYWAFDANDEKFWTSMSEFFTDVRNMGWGLNE